MTTRREFLKSVSAGAAVLAVAGRAGAADVSAMTKKTQAAMTPDRALASLKEGNERFVGGTMLQRDLAAQVRATASGQFPYAVVLGCLDSRTSPELVFDQGIGDIFCGRVAGNFANTDLIGSLEFATKLSGAKLIVVLGHNECGAVMGACDNARLGNLTQTLSNLMPAVYAVTGVEGQRSSGNGAFVQSVAEENVRLNVEALTERSAVLAGLVREKKLRIVGAMHDITTGRVTFS